MKAFFFGTSAFAVPSLRVLAERAQVCGVVTQPDRAAGRGHKLMPTPVKSAALELGLPVYQPERLAGLAEEIAAARAELFVLASYGKILPQRLLDVPALGALNVHPSLLPAYRGATPIQTALRNGDRETGVSIMMMDAGMDTGAIVLQERSEIQPDETYGELHDRLAVLGAKLLGDAIELARVRRLEPAPQAGEPSLTRPIVKADLAIDWSWPARRIVDTVRAFAPQPAARATLFGIPVKILRAHVAQAEPDGSLLVPARDGFVAVDELVAPNRGREFGETFFARERSGAVIS